MIVPNLCEDLHTCHQGTMPNRAYYIPASSRRDDLVEHREHSDRFQLLNGNWKFKYYVSIHDMSELFYELGFDTRDYDSIPVPSVWQNHGYGQQQGADIHHPSPADPPHVPYENPCGAYVNKFTYQKDEKAPRVYLNFEGVDSCFYAWLNGQCLGCSEVSHITSEFDVTDKIVEGENTLAVLVLSWCDGSYPEDRDKFPTSGIFRDVYLLKRPEQHIRDYFLTTQIADREATVCLRFAFHGEKTPVAIKLLNADQKIVAQAGIQDFDGNSVYTHQAVFTVKNPLLWNLEQPYLYTLLLETENEVITSRVGLRCIHIDNNQVYLNGAPIKFHVVNRNDSDPAAGSLISLEYMMRDLKMIKEYNFNAIRTSQYPKAPIVRSVV